MVKSLLASILINLAFTALPTTYKLRKVYLCVAVIQNLGIFSVIATTNKIL